MFVAVKTFFVLNRGAAMLSKSIIITTSFNGRGKRQQTIPPDAAGSRQERTSPSGPPDSRLDCLARRQHVLGGSGHKTGPKNRLLARPEQPTNKMHSESE